MAWMEFEKVKSYERPLSKESEQELLLRLDRGEKLSRSDMACLVQCNCVEEATTDINRTRLTEDVRTISKLGDRYFAIDWERELQGFGEWYYEQPVEVQLEEKTIKVREWNEKINKKIKGENV